MTMGYYYRCSKKTLKGHSDENLSVAFSSDGRLESRPDLEICSGISLQTDPQLILAAEAHGAPDPDGYQPS